MPKQPSESLRTFGTLLRRYREAAGLSQEALADCAGLSSRGLLYLERGMHRPYPATMRRLADALTLTAQEREALALAAQLHAPSSPVAPLSNAAPVPIRDSIALPLLPQFMPVRETATPSFNPQHNLPATLSSFIGRERAQARVNELLAAHRMVTLVGSGGVGKTRLALAVGKEILAAFPDGVWLVELAPLADSGLVPAAVVQALGLQEEPGRAVPETLSDHCKGKRLLLILDNCEHLVVACATLAGMLLRAAPCLHVLATSREALGVAGECSYRVPSLSIPDPRRLPSPELAGSFEAVRLFVARAQERRENFALTGSNARAVAEICARLDGVPLAIELAAARMGSMGVEAIASRLDDRFQLLCTGSRDLPTRQRTLRATLDWSWDLLDARERTVLSRLSVFAGGWTLEAAEAVCAGDEIASWAVLDGLDGLVHRSLVQVDETAEGADRYRLLETVRQYAGERLAAAGEEATTRDLHLNCFLALALQADPALRGAEQGPWLDRLEQEHDNLRAALGWARERARGEEGLRLASSLWRFWEIRGHLGEGRRWLEEMLVSNRGSPATRARALNGAGNLARRQGEYRISLALHQEALALRRELGDTQGIATSLTNVASAMLELGDFTRAEALYAEGLVLYRALGDLWGSATALNNLGLVARGLGQVERATGLLTEGLALRREQGDRRGIAESLNNLGLVASAQREYGKAARLFEESLLLTRDLSTKHIQAEALEGLAWAAAARGQSRRAARLCGAAEAERDVLGLPAPSSDSGDHDRAVQAMRAALGEETFAVAWAEGQALVLEAAISLALEADPAG